MSRGSRAIRLLTEDVHTFFKRELYFNVTVSASNLNSGGISIVKRNTSLLNSRIYPGMSFCTLRPLNLRPGLEQLFDQCTTPEDIDSAVDDADQFVISSESYKQKVAWQQSPTIREHYHRMIDKLARNARARVSHHGEDRRIIKIKEPSKEAIQAYFLRVTLGWKQEDIAETMTKWLKPEKPFKQYQICRLVKKARKWLKVSSVNYNFPSVTVFSALSS